MKDPAKISWSTILYRYAKINRPSKFDKGKVRVSINRPYVKEYLYFDELMNEATYQMPQIFPEHDTKNLVICIPGVGNKKDFSVLMIDCLPDLQLVMNGQCFPLHWYSEGVTIYESGEGVLFKSLLISHDGIWDSALVEFRTHYGDKAITKEEIFYYVYGVLSSREYASRFGNDAKKVLARVTFVKDIETFRKFSGAGRKLGALHVGYESAEEALLEVRHDGGRITKLTVNKKDKNDKSTWEICGPGVRVAGIPACAWEYKVNGKSALEWIVERYKDDVDKASGIRNDCNEWARAEYVLSLIRRVVTVSVETVRILEGLPELGV